MPQRILRGAITLAALLFPVHVSLAASVSPTDQLHRALRPVIKQLAGLSVTSATAGKVYTDTKYGFSLTLPSGWKKAKATAHVLFTAQPTNDNTVDWLMTSSKYANQKKADSASRDLKTNPQGWGGSLLEEFKSDFPDGNCAVALAQKKTLGSFTGARVDVNCTLGTTDYTFSVFSFVHKLRFYGITYLIPVAQFSASLPLYNSITRSLKFTN